MTGQGILLINDQINAYFEKKYPYKIINGFKCFILDDFMFSIDHMGSDTVVVQYPLEENETIMEDGDCYNVVFYETLDKLIADIENDIGIS